MNVFVMEVIIKTFMEIAEVLHLLINMIMIFLKVCHQSCATCAGPFSSQCMSCLTGNEFVVIESNGIGKCQCPKAKFSSGSGTCSSYKNALL